ncbi:hypothetical protein TREMEDRAFT_58709 [Tremella mesenterica DSM 1558]|uniref:uncharacterized protein n=1 Tax=Tremella mesenterica (strain ATCC 24925 / CBS 8224 / DSM 1558 / NBRC 9311 / NRRL Y-6157 / RJB 2259-6 / UBC 559-6) TaxID=578456 RepID=UPI0003F495AA|nr:uncharacterized protein TREMEDRAFT_58709 [Tremella mesenterica DSM 1558]EIW72537.1 hypothetical protein TREMEDRAFT_58709 [Tremella mesenterica DSM 1558]
MTCTDDGLESTAIFKSEMNSTIETNTICQGNDCIQPQIEENTNNSDMSMESSTSTSESESMVDGIEDLTLGHEQTRVQLKVDKEDVLDKIEMLCFDPPKLLGNSTVTFDQTMGMVSISNNQRECTTHSCLYGQIEPGEIYLDMTGYTNHLLWRPMPQMDQHLEVYTCRAMSSKSEVDRETFTRGIFPEMIEGTKSIDITHISVDKRIGMVVSLLDGFPTRTLDEETGIIKLAEKSLTCMRNNCLFGSIWSGETYLYRTQGEHSDTTEYEHLLWYETPDDGNKLGAVTCRSVETPAQAIAEGYMRGSSDFM